jgi:hypothetical protein
VCLGTSTSSEEARLRENHGYASHSKSLSATTSWHPARSTRFADFVFPSQSVVAEDDGDDRDDLKEASSPPSLEVSSPGRRNIFYIESDGHDQQFERYMADSDLPEATTKLFIITKALLAIVSVSLFPAHLPLMHPVSEEDLRFCSDVLEDILAGFDEFYSHLEARRLQIEAVLSNLTIEDLGDPENAEACFVALRHRLRQVLLSSLYSGKLLLHLGYPVDQQRILSPRF